MPTLAPVVSILNMKGGVGKTTISAHVMRVLYHRHKVKTLLIDLDPQFNLTQALIIRSRYDTLKQAEKTVFSVMEPASTRGIFNTNLLASPPPQASAVAQRLRYIKNSPIELCLVPGDFRLVKYSLIESSRKLTEVRKRFQRFIGEARKAYDLICVDCNPSSSFITRCALTVCTELIAPVRPDLYSVLGVEMLIDLLDRLDEIAPKPQLSILLNGVPRRNYNRRIENELRGHSRFGTSVLANRLPQSGLLEAKPGYTGFATDRPVPYRNLLKSEIINVVDELVERFGIAT